LGRSWPVGNPGSDCMSTTLSPTKAELIPVSGVRSAGRASCGVSYRDPPLPPGL
jgi:hypothetical protein